MKMDNNAWIKDLKVGDEVILEIKNLFRTSMDIHNVKSISQKRRHITLDNGFKFDETGNEVSNKYSTSIIKIYAVNKQNIEKLESFKKSTRGLEAIGLIYDNVNNIKDKISPDDYQTIYEIITKYNK